MAKSPLEIFRDYEIDGVPSSGPHTPIKKDIREWAISVEGGSGGGGGADYSDEIAVLDQRISNLKDTTAINLVPRDRPGDSRALFTDAISGAGTAVDVVPTGTVAVNERGSVLRVPSASEPVIVSMRQDFAIEPGQVYAARWAFSRFKNTSDVLGDAVECRIAWLDKDKQYISVVVADSRSLSIYDGRRYVSKTFSLDQTADITAPASAVYARVNIRLLGGNGITDIEIIDAYRTNGLPGVPGSDGLPPSYEVDGVRIRWAQPDGTPGEWIDLNEVVGFNFRAGWTAAETYDAPDLVTYGNSVYVARRESTGVEPGTSEADWRLFVPGGTVGDGAITDPKLAAGSQVQRTTFSSYDSLQAAAATQIPDQVGYVRAAGYAAPIDGGEGLFELTDIEPPHPLKAPAIGGKWLEAALTNRLRPEIIGGKGDGQTDCTQAIGDIDDFIVTKGVGCHRFDLGAYLVASDMTLDGPVAFDAGARLVPADGKTVRLKGGLAAAPEEQIFDLSAGGIVRLPQALREAPARWWGAKIGRTDNEVPIQQGLDALHDQARAGGVLLIGQELLTCSGMIRQRNNTRIRGVNGRWSGLKMNSLGWNGDPHLILSRNYEDATYSATMQNGGTTPTLAFGANGITGVTRTGTGQYAFTFASHVGIGNSAYYQVAVSGLDKSLTVTATPQTATTFAVSIQLDGVFTDVFGFDVAVQRFISQFHCGIEALMIDQAADEPGNGSHLIEQVIYAPSWQEDSGLFRCVMLNVFKTAVRIDHGYGGSSIFNVVDSEIFGLNGGMSSTAKLVDVDMTTMTTGWSFLNLHGSSIIGGDRGATSFGSGVQVDGRVQVLAERHSTEHLARGFYMLGPAKLHISGIRGGVAMGNLVERWSSATGEVTWDQSPGKGFAEHFLLDVATGTTIDEPKGHGRFPYAGDTLWARIAFKGADGSVVSAHGATVERTGVGVYSVYFDEDIPASVKIHPSVTLLAASDAFSRVTTLGTSGVQIACRTPAGAAVDPDTIYFAAYA